ncbi:FkbM family methyltransferase [Adhaeribacter radiodurans]|uniref:FkbM family methyltransferase n=1 Tax=Adhaeribacter radiodurans TaxID=2745197 RepID=A0A7L7L493_9BACT|nr:FkbM family methyltransferase [Adhaeribacter radiodurans]QMU27632.1 FkbM family methyltransferase [Adhaeribacter radiodurans]
MHPLSQALTYVERLAQATKLQRFWAHPLRYAWAILFRQLIYPRTRRPAYQKSKTFFGEPMTVALPAATDIYLTGGKSHDSEIRLARFLIQNLTTGDQFLDVGAHFGYFSLLAAKLVRTQGRVLAFEASQTNYELLEQNTSQVEQINVYHQAVSDQEGTLTFYQFPIQFSEYNSRDIAQYQHESWFQKYPPEKITVSAVTIDSIVQPEKFTPKIIKIDVEGGEQQVIKGGTQTWVNLAPLIVMEYLTPTRLNTAHQQARRILQQYGYKTFAINAEGVLVPCPEPDQYLAANKLDSDNLVFRKK